MLYVLRKDPETERWEIRVFKDNFIGVTMPYKISFFLSRLFGEQFGATVSCKNWEDATEKLNLFENTMPIIQECELLEAGK